MPRKPHDHQRLTVAALDQPGLAFLSASEQLFTKSLQALGKPKHYGFGVASGLFAGLLWSPLAFAQSVGQPQAGVSGLVPQELPHTTPLKLPDFLNQSQDGQLTLPPVQSSAQSSAVEPDVTVAASALPLDLPRTTPLKLPEFLNQGQDGQLVLPPVEHDLAPAPSSGTTQAFTLREVKLQGNRAIATEDLMGLLSPYLNTSVNADQVEEMRVLLTRLYVDRGYINSGALVSKPLDSQGELGFEIVEGRVSAVVIRGNDGLNEKYISSRLGIDQSKTFNVETLRDNLPRIYADPLIKQINVQVLPGANRGEAIVDASVVRARPWSAYVSADNARSPSVGENQINAGFDYRNLTGQGDLLSLRASKPLKKGYRLGGDFYMPLGYVGTTGHIGFNQGSSTTAEGDFADKYSNRSRDFEFGLNQDLYSSLANSLSLELARVQRRSDETFEGAPYPFETGLGDPTQGNVKPAKVSTNRLALSGTNRGQRYALSARVAYNKGSSNYSYSDAQKRINGDTKLFSDVDYSYLLWQFQGVYQINDRNDQVMLRAIGQRSNQHLPGLERFSLGGSTSVRGFREGVYSADSGYAATLELQINLPSAGDLQTRLIPFYDFGKGNKTSKQENLREASLSATGLGVEFRFRDLTARVDWAKTGKSDGVTDSNGNALQDKGITFSLRWNF